MSQSIFTQSSVSLTTTPEYLPVSGFNTLSLHLSQSPRLHPSQISQTNCNNPSNVSHTWPACDNTQLSKSRSKHENKLTAKFPVSFQVQFKTVSTSYTTQVVSIDLQYYMFNSNTSTTATQTDIRGYLMHLRNQNQRSQTGKQSSLWPCLLTVRCQPTISTPSSTVPSVPWRFLSLSLSALQYLHCQANHHASGFNLKVTSQCKHPSSPTVPAHYRTSGVQLLTSYHKNVWQLNQGHWQSKFDPPGSHANVSQMWQLNQGHRPSRLSCQRFSSVATKPRSPTLQALMPTFLFPTTISRHDARLSSTTHCALRASRINYNLTNLSRCNSFS